MAKTRAQLVTRILQKLQVVGAGQSQSSEDGSLVDDTLDGLIAEIDGFSARSIPDPANVPEEAFEYVAQYCAAIIAPDFGLPFDEGARQLAQRNIQRVLADTYNGSVAQADYF